MSLFLYILSRNMYYIAKSKTRLSGKVHLEKSHPAIICTVNNFGFFLDGFVGSLLDWFFVNMQLPRSAVLMRALVSGCNMLLFQGLRSKACNTARVSPLIRQSIWQF